LTKKYLRVANVYADRLELNDIAEIGTNVDEFTRTSLRAGDVLIVEGNGSVEQIGRAALWRGEIAECAHQNHLIRWRSHGGVIPEFALYWLLSPSGRKSLVEFASSTTGLHTLSLSKVSAVPLSVPPLDEQVEMVRRVSDLLERADQLKARLDSVLAAIDSSTASLLEKAFCGELVPQDPSDEPASALLARLRSEREAAPTPPRRRARTPA
jgi:type I restriction enzyme S subunit